MGIVNRFLLLSTTGSLSRAFAYARQESDSYISVIESAKNHLSEGKILDANRIFDSSVHFFEKNEYFQHEYINFLMKTGQFERITELKNIISSNDEKRIQDAKDYLKVLKSNDIEAISKLHVISPYSYEINMVYIKNLIVKKSYNQALQAVNLIISYFPSQREAQFLKVYIFFQLGRFLEFCNTYNQNVYFRSHVKLVYDMLNLERYNMNMYQKFSYLVEYHKEANKILFNSPYEFEPIKIVVAKLLERIVITGLDINKPVAFYAEKLLSHEETPNNISIFIKSLVYEKSFNRAIKVLEKYKNNLNEASYQNLGSFITSSKKAYEDEVRQKEEEERKRQSRYQNNNNHFDQARTRDAGRDFLGHYNSLGLKPGASIEEVDKAYKTKLREVQRTAKKKKLSSADKDQLIKPINMANTVLSDPKKKDLYDRGFDPAQPANSSHHDQHDGRNGGGYHEQRFHFNNDDIFQDFFQGFFQQGGGNSFFGGGNQGNGRRFRQQRVIYIN